jgi:hypothetical protein
VGGWPVATGEATDGETEADDFENDLEGEGETDTGGISEGDWEGRGVTSAGGAGSSMRNGVSGNNGVNRGDLGGSTLFLPGDTIFGCPMRLRSSHAFRFMI